MSSESGSRVRASEHINVEPDGQNPQALDAIRKANAELSERSADQLELPIKVLVEQRDAALRALAEAQATAQEAREKLVIEQDSFITFLMGEHEQKQAELKAEFAAQIRSLQLQKAVGQSQQLPAVSPAPPGSEPNASSKLQQLLEAAYAEIDDTRADAARLQDERDEAIRSIDDIKLEAYSEVEKARDEAFKIQTELDETNRLLEDARDASRDRTLEFAEELDQARRALDDRNDEVRRLRSRLSVLTQEAQHSRPPPPPASSDLLQAREEAQTLRRQLIEAKREVSRLARELSLATQVRVKPPPTTK